MTEDCNDELLRISRVVGEAANVLLAMKPTFWLLTSEAMNTPSYQEKQNGSYSNREGPDQSMFKHIFV